MQHNPHIRNNATGRKFILSNKAAEHISPWPCGDVVVDIATMCEEVSKINVQTAKTLSLLTIPIPYFYFKNLFFPSNGAFAPNTNLLSSQSGSKYGPFIRNNRQRLATTGVSNSGTVFNIYNEVVEHFQDQLKIPISCWDPCSLTNLQKRLSAVNTLLDVGDGCCIKCSMELDEVMQAWESQDVIFLSSNLENPSSQCSVPEAWIDRCQGRTFPSVYKAMQAAFLSGDYYDWLRRIRDRDFDCYCNDDGQYSVNGISLDQIAAVYYEDAKLALGIWDNCAPDVKEGHYHPPKAKESIPENHPPWGYIAMRYENLSKNNVGGELYCLNRDASCDFIVQAGSPNYYNLQKDCKTYIPGWKTGHQPPPDLNLKNDNNLWKRWGSDAKHFNPEIKGGARAMTSKIDFKRTHLCYASRQGVGDKMPSCTPIQTVFAHCCLPQAVDDYVNLFDFDIHETKNHLAVSDRLNADPQSRQSAFGDLLPVRNYLTYFDGEWARRYNNTFTIVNQFGEEVNREDVQTDKLNHGMSEFANVCTLPPYNRAMLINDVVNCFDKNAVPGDTTGRNPLTQHAHPDQYNGWITVPAGISSKLNRNAPDPLYIRNPEHKYTIGPLADISERDLDPGASGRKTGIVVRQLKRFMKGFLRCDERYHERVLPMNPSGGGLASHEHASLWAQLSCNKNPPASPGGIGGSGGNMMNWEGAAPELYAFPNAPKHKQGYDAPFIGCPTRALFSKESDEAIDYRSANINPLDGVQYVVGPTDERLPRTEDQLGSKRLGADGHKRPRYVVGDPKTRFDRYGRFQSLFILYAAMNIKAVAPLAAVTAVMKTDKTPGVNDLAVTWPFAVDYTLKSSAAAAQDIIEHVFKCARNQNILDCDGRPVKFDTEDTAVRQDGVIQFTAEFEPRACELCEECCPELRSDGRSVSSVDGCVALPPELNACEKEVLDKYICEWNKLVDKLPCDHIIDRYCPTPACVKEIPEDDYDCSCDLENQLQEQSMDSKVGPISSLVAIKKHLDNVTEELVPLESRQEATVADGGGDDDDSDDDSLISEPEEGGEPTGEPTGEPVGEN